MKKLVLIAIVFLGLVLRLYRLADRPLGFTWDEAALGYNAYSLLQTGRDEHGQVAPIVFKSFGDYKPGLYVYLAVPAIAAFDLTEFATRLPSALNGTLLIALVYLLAHRLFGRRPAIWAAVLIAINPWATHFSKGAWESNVSLTITVLAVVLFLRRRPLLSFIFFGLTLWTYQGAKLFTPLLILSLIWFFRQRINFKSWLKPAAVLSVIAAPIIFGAANQSGRLKVFSVFSYTRPIEVAQEILRQDNTFTKDLTYYLFHGELLDQLRGVTQRYLNHLSPRFLFFEGDWANPRQATPFYGYLHLPEMITFILGLSILFRGSTPKFILAWLLLAPLPSALSRDIVSAVRSLNLIVPLTIISGLGLSFLFTKKLLALPFLLILLLSTLYFLDLYFVHSPYYTASGWLYQYKPVLTLVKNHLDSYSHVVISDKLGQPYIFALFYLKIDPAKFQGKSQSVDSPVGDVGAVTNFANFEFRSIFWPSDRASVSTLFVGDEYELPTLDLQTTPGIVKLGEIVPPDGRPVWRVVALP